MNTEDNFVDFIKYKSYTSYNLFTSSYMDDNIIDSNFKGILESIYSPMPTIIDTLQYYMTLADTSSDQTFININNGDATLYLNSWETPLRTPTSRYSSGSWNSFSSLYDTDFSSLFLTQHEIVIPKYSSKLLDSNKESLTTIHLINRIILSLISYTFDYLYPASSFVRCSDNNQLLLNTYTKIFHLLTIPPKGQYFLSRNNPNSEYHSIGGSNTGYYTTSCNNIIDYICVMTNNIGMNLTSRTQLQLSDNIIMNNESTSMIFQFKDQNKTTGDLWLVLDRLVPKGLYNVQLDNEITLNSVGVRFFVLYFKNRLFNYGKSPNSSIIMGRNPNFPITTGSSTGKYLLPMINNSQCSYYLNQIRRFRISTVNNIPIQLIGNVDVFILTSQVTKKIFNVLYNNSNISSILNKLSDLGELDYGSSNGDKEPTGQENPSGLQNESN